MDLESEDSQKLPINSERNDIDSINSESFENNNGDEKLIISEDENDNNYQENSNILLENIIKILEKFTSTFKDEKKLLFNVLKEINIIINLLINEFVSNYKKKFDLNDYENNINNFFLTENINENNNEEENKNAKLDTNSKVVFLLKIDILNRKIVSLNEEIKNLKLLLFNSNNKLYKNKTDNYYKFFMKRFKDIKDRKKCDDYKFLMFIDNQKKKIMELEEKLKKKKHENLPQETLKAIRCFPNFIQYNFKEDINPKTIPLTQYFQQEKEKEKEIFKSTPKKKIINSNSVKNKHIKTNQLQHFPFNINSTYSHRKKRNRIKEITLDDKTKTYQNNNKVISIKDIKNNFKMLSIRNNIYSNNQNNRLYDSDDGKLISKNKKKKDEKNIKKLYQTKNDLKNEIKDFNPKTIMTNKKEFFIAHPTLDIAGVAKGKEQIYIGLPKKLLRLNKGGNFKSTMMVFPSSLNETMVNLEKLRNNKLHVDINKKENEKD